MPARPVAKPATRPATKPATRPTKQYVPTDVDGLFDELFGDEETHPALADPEKKTGTIAKIASISEPVTVLIAMFQALLIRIMGTIAEPLFVATDVARHIGDTHNSSVFQKQMSEEYVQMGYACNSRGKSRKVALLTEIGLYKYLLQSKKKLAEEFQLFTYDLLTKERKRTVDESRLALKIEQDRRHALQRENAVAIAIQRDSKIELGSVRSATITARDQNRKVQKELRAFWRENVNAADYPAEPEDEYPIADDDETPIERQSPTKPKMPPCDQKDGTSETEIMTPLVALFETRGIRLDGTVSEPCLRAADLAKYIKDNNGDRIFREQTPEVYIRWINLPDAQGQLRATRFLTEAGAYRYLLRSTLPGAEAFQVFTYDLLKAERKRTVDNIQLALKIERTRIEEQERMKAAARAAALSVGRETDRCLRIANEARDTLSKSRAHLKELRDKKETDRIRHYWAPWAPPA